MGIKMRFRGSAAIVAMAIALSGTPQIAHAHTSLVSSDPAAGSTVTSWPTEISLEFDEELISIGDEKSNFIVVNNGVGDQISSDNEVISGSKITVSLDPNTIEGPVLVYYRVISADGHPVEGEYTFTFGVEPKSEEGVQNNEKSKNPNYLFLASAAFITTFLFFGIYAYRRRENT
jgi:methionine-rich copper-binding protein CopC